MHQQTTNAMKTIIQRALPLDVKYALIDKKYSSIEEGGWCCDNCGRLIANIATVENDLKSTYYIGFDCLETFLINNALLDGKSVEEYTNYKKHLPTFIKHAKQIKETICNHNTKQLHSVNKISSLMFEVSDFIRWSKYGKSTCLTFHYITECGKTYNDNFRVKNEYNVYDLIDAIKSVAKIYCILK